MKQNAAYALCAVIMVAVWCAPLAAQAPATRRPGQKWIEYPVGDAKSEAAHKEVLAYYVAFSQMDRVLGMKKTLAYFLTPDYKWVRATGPVLGREAAIAEKARQTKQSLTNYYGGKREPEMLMVARTRETYTLQKNTITVVKHNSEFYVIPEWAAPPGQAKRPHRRHDVAVSRQVYKRTIEGLRLQEEREVSHKSYWDGTMTSR